MINGYFIEANIDSNTKFNILKRLLVVFELEDELIIKYSSDSDDSGSDNRFTLRKKFWKLTLSQIKDTGLFKNVNPSKDHWLSSGAGVSGISYTLIVTRADVRLELTISSSSKELNKRYFHHLIQNKTEVEKRFGEELIWEELPDHKMSKITFTLGNVSLFEESDWDAMSAFLVDNLPKFENAFKPEIARLKKN